MHRFSLAKKSLNIPNRRKKVIDLINADFKCVMN